MKNTALNLQDLFLNNARKERIPVTIYLMNGVKVNGQVKGFDSYIIMLEDEKKQQNMIYKHAVSTIQPSRHINMQNNNTQNKKNQNAPPHICAKIIGSVTKLNVGPEAGSI